MASGEQAPSAYRLYRLILGQDNRFYGLVLVYGIAVSVLAVSLPLSVQVLISTVANAAIERQVLVLAVVLFVLLCLSGLFVALQVWVMELFERRFFSRTLGDVALRLVYARHDYMESINREELMNRFFDVMTVQKSLPPLLTGGLASITQLIVGVALTSFYHPIFLVFNGIAIVAAWFIYRIFDRGAGRSALDLSTTKYAAAEWLETLARANTFFKSNRTIEFAMNRTLAVRDDYIREHRRHFRYAISQIIGFLLLYAATSAALLGTGGLLVINGQLTIGQLVAAELVLSGVFYGLSRVGYYLELHYDLYAALNKLSHLYDIPHEEVRNEGRIGEYAPEVRFVDVACQLRSVPMRLDFTLPAGSTTLALPRSGAQIDALIDLLLGYRRPDHGRVEVGRHAVEDFSVHRLRDEVHVIDSTLLPDCSIAEFLSIANPEITRSRMRELLDVVGLDTTLPELSDDLDHELTPHGYPLSVIGVIKLKVAFALAAQPKVLVLTPLFDTLSQEARESIIDFLERDETTTVLCLSHRPDLGGFDQHLLLDFNQQPTFDDPASLFAAYEGLTGNRPAAATAAMRGKDTP